MILVLGRHRVPWRVPTKWRLCALGNALDKSIDSCMEARVAEENRAVEWAQAR